MSQTPAESTPTCSVRPAGTCLVRKGQVAVQRIQVLYELVEVSTQRPQHVVIARAFAEFKEILSKLSQNHIGRDTWQNKDTLMRKKGLKVLEMLSGGISMNPENLQHREGTPKSPGDRNLGCSLRLDPGQLIFEAQ